MDFEAKARELLTVLPVRPHVTGAVEILAVADALRAAALDEGAREAARAELTRLLAELKQSARRPPPTGVEGEAAPVADVEAVDQAVSAAILNPAASETYGPSPLRPLYGPWRTQCDLLERLLWLLGLSGGERRFVRALADDAADFDTALVYADWLLDQGRTADGARVRRLVPRDGDVVLWHAPMEDPDDVDPVAAAGSLAQAVRDRLMARGVETFWVVLPADSHLETAPADAMRVAGWVRAADVANRLADLAGDLGDCWGPGTARMIGRHFNDLFDPPVPPAPEAPP